jgi:hypothetical protein
MECLPKLSHLPGTMEKCKTNVFLPLRGVFGQVNSPDGKKVAAQPQNPSPSNFIRKQTDCLVGIVQNYPA